MTQLPLLKSRRIHIAIMKPAWRFLPQIEAGKKTIESRWYNNRCSPWDKINPGDMIYFKDSGQPVTLRAEVTKVRQFEQLDPTKIRKILSCFGLQIGIDQEALPHFAELLKNKKYGILIYLQNPRRVKPFTINKSGFGAMCSWITVDNLSQVKGKSDK
jgi:ASC-1-like (ASCH) protein